MYEWSSWRLGFKMVEVSELHGEEREWLPAEQSHRSTRSNTPRISLEQTSPRHYQKAIRETIADGLT